jgi:hypothetical protein
VSTESFLIAGIEQCLCTAWFLLMQFTSNQHVTDMDVERETDPSTTANNTFYIVYLLATVVLSRLPFARQYSIESQVIKPI